MVLNRAAFFTFQSAPRSELRGDVPHMVQLLNQSRFNPRPEASSGATRGAAERQQ